jgi:hypothetical protein
MDSAGLRYYESLTGAWTSRFSFRVTDGRALRARGLFVWLQLRMFAVAAAMGTRMSTTLSRTKDANTFRHTTRVSLLGFTLYVTEEDITLGEDGTAFTMTGIQRVSMAKSEPYAGNGAVSDDAQGATYHVPFYGADLTQRTLKKDGGLLLTQETEFSKASVHLMRTAGS